MRAILLLALLVALPVAPQDPAAEWKRCLDVSTTHLKTGEFGKAHIIVESILFEMNRSLGTGTAPTEILGIALTHKALALAGLGRKDDALWWWHVVVSMYPPFAKSDLSSFGEAGAFLTTNRELPKIDHLPSFDEELKDRPGIRAPRVRRQPMPKFPKGAAWFRVEETLVVRMVIRTDGTVASPRVIQGVKTPTFVYATMAAVKDWTFEPAKQDGAAVASVFELTVNYRLHR